MIRKAKSSNIIFGAVDPTDDDTSVYSNAPPLPNHPPPSSTESDEIIHQGFSTPVKCPNQTVHSEGRILSSTVVEITPDLMYNIIFGNNKLMDEVYSRNKTYDVAYEPWKTNEETGNSERTLTYKMELPPTGLGPKASSITETQTLLSISKPGHLYIIETEATNSGIPYADNFCIQSHYCITRETENGDTAKYFASAKVKYHKSTWGFIKGIIEKNAFNGMENIQDDLSQCLQQQPTSKLDHQLNMVKRRKRRTASADFRSQKFERITTPVESKINIEDKFIYSVRCWFVSCLLISLVALNFILFYKLKYLELHATIDEPVNVSNDEKILMKRWISTGRSWEDITKLLEMQENLHTKQIQDWIDLLMTSSDALDTAEKSIKKVKNTLTEYRKQRTKELSIHLEEETKTVKV